MTGFEWEHAMRSHLVRLPEPTFDVYHFYGSKPNNYWLEVIDTTMYVCVICDECGYVSSKELDLT